MKKLMAMVVAAAAVVGTAPAVASEWQEILQVSLDERQVLVHHAMPVAPELQIYSTRVLKSYDGDCSAEPMIRPVGRTKDPVDAWGRPLIDAWGRPIQGARVALPWSPHNMARDPQGRLGKQLLLNNGNGATVREVEVTYTPRPLPPGTFRPAVYVPPCTLHVYVQVD